MDEKDPLHAELAQMFNAYLATFNKFNKAVEHDDGLFSPTRMLKKWIRWQLDRRGYDKVRSMHYAEAVELWNAMLMAFPLGLVEIDNPVLAPIPVEYQHELPQVTPEWADAMFNRLWADGMWPDTHVSVPYVLTIMNETRPK